MASSSDVINSQSAFFSSSDCVYQANLRAVNFLLGDLQYFVTALCKWTEFSCNCLLYKIIGIKHCFPCINVCQVSREALKTEAEGRGFQHLPRDLANVNVLENNV